MADDESVDFSAELEREDKLLEKVAQAKKPAIKKQPSIPKVLPAPIIIDESDIPAHAVIQDVFEVPEPLEETSFQRQCREEDEKERLKQQKLREENEDREARKAELAKRKRIAQEKKAAEDALLMEKRVQKNMEWIRELMADKIVKIYSKVQKRVAEENLIKEKQRKMVEDA